MALTKPLASTQRSPHRNLCMTRPRTKVLREYLTMAKENEALWALIAVIAMTVFLEVYTWL